MGQFSDDPAVDGAVAAAEADYLAAQDAVRANPDDPAVADDYRAKRDAFAAARQTSRADRPGLGITAEGGE